MRFSKHLMRKKTPQSAPIIGAGQVRNDAGGHVWAVDRWALLERFLILGTEGGTYYATEERATKESAENLSELLVEDGPRAVDTIAKISRQGRAPKNGPALFALALASSIGNDDTRQAAYAALPVVARTGTHLFQFISESEELRGWGRGLRRAVSDWYNAREVDDLVYQVTKYRNREKWTHADLVRLAHPKPASAEHGAVYRWLINGEMAVPIPRLEAFVRLQSEREPSEAAKLIRAFDLPREAVPKELATHPMVWEALLDKMPLTAMLRNLANMTRYGLLTPGAEATRHVVSSLTDPVRLRAARIHPVAILLALATYERGTGRRGQEWMPVPAILQALNEAFHLAFESVVPTGKRILIGLDISGSMKSALIPGSGLSAAKAAVALSLVTLAREESAQVLGFSDRLVPLGLHGGMTITEVMARADRANFGATDCALPMIWATENRQEVDAFVILTDNETWCGVRHPSEALGEYRHQSGIDARLIIVAMTANQFTIADPRDPGMLDVVGFDPSVPKVMEHFIRGEF
ncbi:MAG: TROVE domain-containing protein [Armatimonadetes bacterium]|nr:TROVE domain-containing protein [Armatimonadota bacterium]